MTLTLTLTPRLTRADILILILVLVLTWVLALALALNAHRVAAADATMITSKPGRQLRRVDASTKGDIARERGDLGRR